MISSRHLITLIVLCLTLSAGLCGQATIYVNATTGLNTNLGTTPAQAVQTITYGVSLVSTGGTVEIAAGSYNEQVVITKGVTLNGIDSQRTIITRTSGQALQIQAAAVTVTNLGVTVTNNTSTDDCIAISVAGTDATLEGLTVRGGYFGLAIAGANGLTARSCVFGGAGQVAGIAMAGNGDNATIQECTFANLTSTSILADAGSGAVLDGWLIEKCTFLNQVAPTVQPGASIDIPRANNLLIRNNDFSGFRAIAIRLINSTRATAGTEPAPTGIAITGNHFHHNHSGCTEEGRGVITSRYGVNNFTVSENIFEDITDASAVLFEVSATGTWQTLDGSKVTGNMIRSLTGQFRGITTGINDVDGITFEGLTTALLGNGNLIRANSFSGNTGNGVRNDNPSAPSVDARWNYWGAAGGPLVVGGAGVSGNVDYTNHLVASRALGTLSWAAGAGPAAIVVDHLNGDSLLDMAVTNYNSNAVSILLADGKGGYSLPTSVTVGNTPSDIETGDFDGDGDLDLAVANNNDGTVSILTNTNGVFAVTATLTASIPVCGITVGRVGTDSRDDLLVAVSRTPFVNGQVLLFTNASGTASPLTGIVQPADLELADLDNDGDLDLVLAETGATAGILLYENVSGTLATTPKGPYSYGVANPLNVTLTVARINGDNLPDIAVGVTPMIALPLPPSQTRLLLGQTGLTLATSTQVATGTGFLHLAAGDLNGNGLTDLFILDMGNDTVTALEDYGTTGFANTLAISPAAMPRAIKSSDLDGDSNDEVIVAGFLAGEIIIAREGTAPLAAIYGSGCTGGNGTPTIGYQGTPAIGDATFQVTLLGAPQQVACALLSSLNQGNSLDLGPCQILVDLNLMSMVTYSSLTGTATMPMPIPNEPFLVNARIYFQWVTLDPQGAMGPGVFGLSSGLRMVIGQ